MGSDVVLTLSARVHLIFIVEATESMTKYVFDKSSEKGIMTKHVSL